MRHDLADYVERVGRSRVERELNVHRTTLTRWLDGTVTPPRTAVLMLAMLAGNYPGTAGQWEGWRFHEGELWSPEGERFRPGDLTGLRYERGALDAYRRENAELKVKITAMSVDPVVRNRAANDAAIDFIPAGQTAS